MDNIVSVSLGRYVGSAVASDGSLYTWGNNAFGLLGDGSGEARSTPEKIMDDVASVIINRGTESGFAAAIRRDGSLWMWGDGYNGQLGDGTSEDHDKPVWVMDNVESVSLGFVHAAAIKNDGSLWMWGAGRYGHFGNSDPYGDIRPTPVKVMDGVIDVSCRDVFTDDRDHSFTAVVLEDGSLWTQGVNDNGQLGDGTIENRYELVKIMDDAVSVSLGGNHSAAIKEDGSLWTWGSNYAGKLGRATSTVEERIVPGRVPGFGGVGSDPAPEPVSGSMHRLYNPWTGEHFYTLSTVERDSLVSVGWEYEGEGWVAPSQGAEVYRLYNPYVEGGDHHYTLSAFERDSLVRAGWRYEGVGWYSASDADGNPVTGAVPLWRQYNPYAATGTHNYTTSEVERDSLVAAGWLPEGVAWYGIG